MSFTVSSTLCFAFNYKYTYYQQIHSTMPSSSSDEEDSYMKYNDNDDQTSSSYTDGGHGSSSSVKPESSSVDLDLLITEKYGRTILKYNVDDSNEMGYTLYSDCDLYEDTKCKDDESDDRLNDN